MGTQKNVIALSFGRLLSAAGGMAVACALAFGIPAAAQAATLYLSPSSGSYAAGANFSVTVMVSSKDQPMNAASGTVTFPSDTVEMTGISKGGSIMNFWTTEPSFSKGSASFEGVVFNPGYTGGAGNVVTLMFKAKAPGKVALGFSRASVLANDGKGTEIMQTAGTASFTVTGSAAAGTPETTAPKPATVPVGVPPAPVITSSTHPGQDAWYANRNPSFAWRLPEGVDGVNILADHVATTDPGTRSDGLRTSWSYKDVEDGVWYFHAKFHNVNGWGPTAHYRFQIDTVQPAPFTVSVADNVATFKTSDAATGISGYTVAVDGGEVHDIAIGQETPKFDLSTYPAGSHVLTVRAYDAAGNMAEATAQATVTAPVVVNAPEPKAQAPAEEPAGGTSDRSLAVRYALVAILVAFLVLIVALLWLARRQRASSARATRRDIASLIKGVHRSHDLLKERISAELHALERKRAHTELTSQEEQAARRLQQHLDEFEAGLEKALERLERQIK